MSEPAADAAYDLLNAIIAAYSSRIGRADNPEEAAVLRNQRAPYLQERASLGRLAEADIRRILADYPAVLQQIRNGR
jgi:hypothetical protein